MKRRIAALAGAAALALGVAGCADEREVEGGGALTIYVSSPLHGPRAADGRAIADGARLALEQARGRAGGIRIRGVYLDDTEGGDWSLARTAANARRAAADVTAIGYIGELDSGATRASLPITNQAGIAQVSAGSTAVDLTRLPPAGDARPERLQPSGSETFARVVPDDEVQGRAAGLWAKQMGAARRYAISDRSPFGETLVDSFAESAGAIYLSFTDPPEPRPRDAPTIAGLVGALTRQKAETIYFGGTAENAVKVLPPIGRAVPGATIFSSDALLDPAFLRAGTEFADRLRLTSPFLDPMLLPAAGQRFLRAYRRRFDRPPAPTAAYGYEAMALLLDAIKRTGDDGDERGAVVDELLATPERRSVLGTYTIDANGDTTLDTVTGYRVADGLPVFPVKLNAPR